MLGGELAGVEKPQHLIEVATGRHRIGQYRFDLFVGSDHEHRAHRGVVRWSTAFGGVTDSLGQHVIEFGDLKVWVPDQRVGDSVPWVSSMSFAQREWLSTGSMLSPMILQLRLSNSGISPAMWPSSVVQTGVKSFGWENRIAHPSPIHLWKLTLPWVVSALKSGTSELILNDMMPLPRLTASPCESWSGTWPTADIPDRARRHCAAGSALPIL